MQHVVVIWGFRLPSGTTNIALSCCSLICLLCLLCPRGHSPPCVVFSSCLRRLCSLCHHPLRLLFNTQEYYIFVVCLPSLFPASPALLMHLLSICLCRLDTAASATFLVVTSLSRRRWSTSATTTLLRQLSFFPPGSPSPSPLLFPVLVVSLPSQGNSRLVSVPLTLNPQYCCIVVGGFVGRYLQLPFASWQVYSLDPPPSGPVCAFISRLPRLPPPAILLPCPPAGRPRPPCRRLLCPGHSEDPLAAVVTSRAKRHHSVKDSDAECIPCLSLQQPPAHPRPLPACPRSSTFASASALLWASARPGLHRRTLMMR